MVSSDLRTPSPDAPGVHAAIAALRGGGRRPYRLSINRAPFRFEGSAEGVAAQVPQAIREEP